MARTKRTVSEKDMETQKTPVSKTAVKKPAIVEVREKTDEFLKQVLNVESVKIIKTSKTEEGWLAIAEVYEDSAFIKELGLKTKVKDKNLYEIQFDSNFEIISYEQHGQSSD